ncbi:MAG: ATP-binding cassette domain-containing protein [Gemmatimonadaceae bacterium]|nr:ATP-binding cassette domain-containing protein [Gemmatimonadaceae bacterium]
MVYRAPRAPTPRVLDGVTLDVHAGEIVVLVGAPRSGKSLILALAAALVEPQGGRVRWWGVAAPPAARDVALVPDDPFALGFLTIGEQLRLAALRLGSDDERAAERAMSTTSLGLVAAKRIANCTAGERARAALAMALLVAPRLLLVDLPLDALNAAERRDVRDILRAFTDRGGSVLATSREPMACAALATRVALLRRGRIGATVDPLPVTRTLRVAEAPLPPARRPRRGFARR